MRTEKNLNCRIVIIGDSGVGKTSLLNRIIGDSFNSYELSTIGANYQTIIQEIDNRNFEIQIWDTAGQEKFKSLSPIYFRNAIGAIGVFSVTSKQSFVHLDDWIDMFYDTVGSDAIVAIAGNKNDMDEEREVSSFDIQTYVKKNQFEFEETSALTGEGVKALFEKLSKRLYQRLTTRLEAEEGIEIRATESKGCSC